MPDIYFTTVDEANDLIAEDAYALVVGLTLYQQVPTEKAFGSPAVLKERLGGSLEVGAVAAMDPDKLTKLFQEPPALHRFPANMAKRTQAVSQYIVDEYGGDTEAIWNDAKDADDLIARLTAIPGFGDYKARLTLGVLAKHYGVKPRGYTKYMPDWPSIVDITKPEDLAQLKVRKKAWKAAKA
jgi:uncharacterized HhH-GPD family protein